jgi:hypothetical protein
MATVRVSWVLPTIRVSGRPIDPSEIDRVDIELAADGAEFVLIDSFPPDVLTTDVTELEVGTWRVRGTVVDTAGKPSAAREASITIVDGTPPDALVALVLAEV